ncbi:MAG: hypothetical protein KME16_00590 [Scytolyngbya sp. HA4215-MV1]|jgi:hypothetical protein|nr:hypothetical protein [Scytolyngbya sp. HA4215-MV1]
MYDNKIRLSQDVLEKAEQIAQEWGLKNARAAVEAVFRRYSDAYLRSTGGSGNSMPTAFAPLQPAAANALLQNRTEPRSHCEALDELDDLLGL